jgi:hypothetical protein
MAQKRKRQKVTPVKVPSSARNTKTRSASIVRERSIHVDVEDHLPERSRSARSHALNVLADLRRDPSLTFTQAARNRGVKPRTIHKYAASALRKDSSGRIKALASDRFRETLYIPGTKPDESIPIRTRNSRERQLIGQWMAALNDAGRGDFSGMSQFPKGTVVGGVRLPTNPEEVQRILEVAVESEGPYEGLYRTMARPS